MSDGDDDDVCMMMRIMMRINMNEIWLHTISPTYVHAGMHPKTVP